MDKRQSKEASEIFAITKALRSRLPREVRNLIYDELLTSDSPTMVAMHNSRYDPEGRNLRVIKPLLQSELHRLTDAQAQALGYQLIDPSARAISLQLMDKVIACEIVEHFYSINHQSSVGTPKYISDFLYTDWFGLGVRPADVPIPAFNIALTLDGSELSKLSEYFQPLLRPEQKWMKNFTLHIELRSRFTAFDDMNHYTKRTLCALEPILDKAENRGAIVKVGLKVDWGLRKGWNGDIRRDFKSMTSEEWKKNMWTSLERDPSIHIDVCTMGTAPNHRESKSWWKECNACVVQ